MRKNFPRSARKPSFSVALPSGSCFPGSECAIPPHTISLRSIVRGPRFSPSAHAVLLNSFLPFQLPLFPVPCVVFLNKPSAISAALARRWFDNFRPQQEARLLDKAQVAVPLSVFSTIFTLNRKCTSLTNPSHRFFIPRRGPRVRVPSCPVRMELAMEAGGLHPGPRGGACICEAKKRSRSPRAGICSYEAEKRARGPRIIE